jgi:hypothetical protein
MTLSRVLSPEFLLCHPSCHGFPHTVALLTIRYWNDNICPLPHLYDPTKHQCNLPAVISLPQGDLEDMADLAGLRSVLMERVQNMMTLCCGYRNTLSQYSYLYVEDRKEILGQFLLYGHVLTPEEIEAHAEDGIPENPPLLHHFKDQIDSYEKLYEEVVSLEPTKVFDGWMRVDVRPFKASLLNTIKKWSLMFKQHLVDFVTNR